MLDYGRNPKPIGRFGDSVGVHQHSRPVTDNIEKWLKNISSPELVEFADQYLKDAFEGAKITGVRFVPISEGEAILGDYEE